MFVRRIVGITVLASDELKVVRGGSWYRRPERATSSWRWRYPRWMAPFDVGFRVVIEE